MSMAPESHRMGEPGWLFPTGHQPHASGDEAAAFLAGQEAEDQHILLLSYGLGLRVGSASQAMAMDPALVVWRLHRAFARWRGDEHTEDEAGCLERGLADLFAGQCHTSLPPLAKRQGWDLNAMVTALPEEVQVRLAENLASTPREVPHAPGVGIGLAVIVLAVVLGFLGFGVVRDVDPMRRGNALMQQYEYSLAREAFVKAGTTEASVRIVLCLLAEGNFEQALAELEDQAVRAWFKQFAPGGPPSPLVDAPAESRALLPRGLLTVTRPAFVIRAGPPGELVITVAGRERRLTLPDTRGSSDEFVVPYPERWPTLPSGRVLWRVEDGNDNACVFDVADKESATRIRERNWRVLTRDIPQKAQLFLRAHHFQAEGLLMQAGSQFARLAELFPAEPYPRQMVWAVAQALGVDPTALLR